MEKFSLVQFNTHLLIVSYVFDPLSGPRYTYSKAVLQRLKELEINVKWLVEIICIVSQEEGTFSEPKEEMANFSGNNDTWDIQDGYGLFRDRRRGKEWHRQRRKKEKRHRSMKQHSHRKDQGFSCNKAWAM